MKLKTFNFFVFYHLMYILLYSYLSKNNTHFLNDKLLSFPKSIRLIIEKYNLDQDKNARILSKLLLLRGLSDLFPNENIDLQFLQTDGKPIYKNLPIHFTSSHSEDLVVVAFSRTQEIGIDIEFKKDLDIEILKDFLHLQEQKILQKSKTTSALFYSLWTKKEALIKASGVGINADFKTIDCSKSETNFYATKYFFKEILIDGNYSCFISSKEKVIKIDCKEIVFL